MPDPTCLLDRALAGAWLAALALLLFVAKLTLLQPRLHRVGSPLPGVSSLAALLHHGRYRGVAVSEEAPGPWGGARYLRFGTRGEIRLERGMLARRDVETLAVLEHERGHAERDLPAPRAYRTALASLFLASLALGLGLPQFAEPAAIVMVTAFVIAALHFLRNEAAASEYALRELWAREIGGHLWRQAIARLAAAYALYLADWTGFALAAAALIALMTCRGGI